MQADVDHLYYEYILQYESDLVSLNGRQMLCKGGLAVLVLVFSRRVHDERNDKSV